MKPRALFTDIGGCLCPDYLEETSAFFTDRLDLAPDRVARARRSFWNNYAYFFGTRQLSAGSKALARIEIQAWSEFAETAEIDATPEEMIDHACQYARPLDPEYETLLGRLQNHGVVLGAISNNTSFFWYRQREALGLERFFPPERVILSCDHGQSKRSPGLELFQAAVAAAGVPAEECVFVDDRAHNVERALEAGFGMAILHPKSVAWGSTYITRILTQAGMLPPIEKSI